MSTDGKPDQPKTLEGPMRTVILLALPLLSLQRDILEVAKKRVQDASGTRPAERFVLSELHALMMILDPSRTFRNRFGQDFEKKVEDAYNEIFPKLASTSLEFIGALDSTLNHVIDALNTLRKSDKASDHSKGQD